MLPTVAFFDSGIGGLSLLQHCSTLMPAHYLYYADNAHMPYGNKSTSFIRDRTLRALDLLSSYNPDLIVVACFSASSSLTAADRKNYPTILSMFDLFSKSDERLNECKKVGIIGTQATIERGALKNHVSTLYPNCTFIQQVCPFLASAIEHQEPIDRLVKLIELYVQPLLEQSIDALILGCTHYELISSLIEDYTHNYLGSSIQLISTKTLLAESIMNNLLGQNDVGQQMLTILSSKELCASYQYLLKQISKNCTLLKTIII